MGWFKNKDAAPQETTPEAAPKEVLETRRTEPATPELSVIKGEKEVTETEAGLTMNDSKFWLVQSEKATQDAIKRFESANKYFRTLKAEGKVNSAKWNKESVRYKTWMEATAQVSIAERLKTECSKLNELTAESNVPIDVPGTATAELLKAINKKYDIKGSIIIQKNIIEILQISFAEHQLNMEEYDAQIIKEDADAEKTAKQKAEREAGLAEAIAARDELDAAEQAYNEKKKGFLGGFLMRIGLGNKGQKDSAAKLKTAKMTSAQMYEKHYEGSYTGPAGSGRATYRDRRDQMTAEMERAVRLFQ